MYSANYKWHFRVNGQAKRWQERLGDALRALAQRIDGRVTLGIAIETSPPISDADKIACVKHGLGAMQWAVEQSTRLECIENVLTMEVRHGAPS